MGPRVHEYRPNPVQSSTHCAQPKGEPAAATLLLFLTGIHREMQDSTGSAVVPPPVPVTNVRVPGEQFGHFFQVIESY